MRRDDPRQELGAIIPRAQTCAGAARKGRPYRDHQGSSINAKTSGLESKFCNKFLVESQGL